MAPRVKPFVFADAWFFASIPDPPVTGEAIPKLYRHGLVRISRGRVVLTEHGQMVREHGRARRGGLFSIVDNVRAALNSPRIKHQVVTRRPNMQSLGLEG